MSQSIKALRAMLEEGISLTEASERYGITKAAISKVKNHPTKNLKILDLQDQIADLTRKIDLAREALDKIGAPKRPDGTYNYCREACEYLANEALSAIKEK